VLLFNNLAIVLNKPRYPENIGSTARAALNWGINRIILVSPQNLDMDKIERLATHNARKLIKNIEIFSDLPSALNNFNYIVGTTARLGGIRKEIIMPKELANSLVEISQNNQVALLFGPENTGLTNNEIKYCNVIVNIPTSDFRSLNLAHAVVIICYEIWTAENKKNNFLPKIATFKETEEMYQELKETLVKISFIDYENPDFWMLRLRRFFSRIKLSAKDAKLIRGICRQIDWYGRRRFKNMNLEDIKKSLED
jgi:tRNA/rRNA methyltransferase